MTLKQLRHHESFTVPLIQVNANNSLKIQTDVKLEAWAKSYNIQNYKESANDTRIIRLFGVDTIEPDQPFGFEALEYLMTEFNGCDTVNIIFWDIDTKSRFICEVMRAGETNPEHSINRKLLREGYAITYRKWLIQAGGNLSNEYKADEAYARNRHVNFWSLPKNKRYTPKYWRRWRKKVNAEKPMVNSGR